MPISDRTTAGTILTLMAQNDVDAPEVVAALGRAREIENAATRIGLGRGALGEAVFAALDAGRDPATDPEVQRAITANYLDNPGVAEAVREAAYGRARAVCDEYRDDIVTAWRKPFNVAAATLAGAYDRIGEVELDNADAILRNGGDIAEVWAKARAAVATIRAIRNGWSTLAEFTRAVNVDNHFRPLNFIDPTVDQWLGDHLRESRIDAWDATRGGYTLALPTFDEYRQRIARITAEVAAAERADHADALAYATGRPALLRIPR